MTKELNLGMTIDLVSWGLPLIGQVWFRHNQGRVGSVSFLKFGSVSGWF